MSVNSTLYVLLLTFSVLLAGCAKEQPKVIYQDVLIPIKCQAKLPKKPVFDSKNPQTAKELSIYYKQVEGLLKECIGE